MLACYDVGDGFEDEIIKQMRDCKVERCVVADRGHGNLEVPGQATGLSDQAPLVGGRPHRAHVPQKCAVRQRQ